MKQFASIATLALTAAAKREMRYVDTEETIPNYLYVKNDDGSVVATGAMNQTRGAFEIDGKLENEFNLIFNVSLGDGYEFKAGDAAELWYCLEVVYSAPKLDYKWDEETMGPAPSYWACHVNKFTYTSADTAEIEYDHYYSPFKPVISADDKPS